ncbi:MAG: hypothetical protein GF329_01945 [Candidatus Lokiarchaeota archaeon]|nr:hypothetical protein [Candidatus Lokiarchaeota archaeon]
MYKEEEELLFFEIKEFKEFVIAISITPGLYLNYMKINGIPILFHILTLTWGEDAFRTAIYYYISEIEFNPKEEPYILFNPRNFEIKLSALPNPNQENISIVQCKKLSIRKQLEDFIAS